MMPRAQLLYFDGCPNWKQARENLRRALAHAGLPEKWEEVDLQAPDTPEAVRGFPSPTVLVDGADVATGARSSPGRSSCRLGSLPSAEIIAAKLGAKTRKGWLAPAAAAPAALLGLFPAAFCPACYPALAGLLSSMGLGALAGAAVVKPVTAVLLLIASGGLFFQARRMGRYAPVALGVLGGVGMYAGLYVIASPPVKFLGIALLIGASIWNIVPAGSNKGGAACPACETWGGESNG